MLRVHLIFVAFVAASVYVDGINQSKHGVDGSEHAAESRLYSHSSGAQSGAAQGKVTEDLCSPINRTMRCGNWWLTNCTTLQTLPACPADCPFRVASPVLGCLFSCVTAENCAFKNGELALPDRDTYVCRSCDVGACEKCNSRTTCETCKPNFRKIQDPKLSNIVQCVYKLDYRLHFDWITGGKAPTLAAVLGIGLVVGIVCGLIFLIVKVCLMDYKQSRQDIARAMRHRHHVKVHSWTDIADRIGVLVDLKEKIHTKDIIGVGFAFFYNAQIFVLVWVLVSLFILVCAKTFAELATHHRPGSGTSDIWQFLATMMAPLSDGRLDHALLGCASASDSLLYDFERNLVFSSFIALWILYLGSILSSLWFLQRQRRAYREFLMESEPLFTHALRMYNFPKAAVYEENITQVIEEHFNTSLVGVSILYDTHKVADELAELVDYHLFDEEYKFENESASSELPDTYFDAYHAEFTETLSSWFTEERIVSSGDIICVFHTQRELQEVVDMFHSKPLHWENGHRIKFDRVAYEPTMICWENIRHRPAEIGGIRWSSIISSCTAMAAAFVFLIFVGAVCYGPLAWYNALHAFETGSLPDAGARAVLGSLVGLANAVAIPALINIAKLAHFLRRDKEEVLISILVTLFFVLNQYFTLFWIPFEIQMNGGGELLSSTASKALLLKNLTTHAETLISEAEALGQNVHDLSGMILLEKVVNSLMHTLVGGVFAGFFFLPVVLFACPYVGSLLSLKLTSRKMRLGEVERTMEPLDMCLGVDLAALLANCIVFVTCFLWMSSSMWKFMEVLLVWCIAYYAFCRYIHLRGFKSVFYHTGMLDTFFHASWQLVIALVCAAACRHGYHMRYWPWWISLIVPLVHVCVFVPLVLSLHLKNHGITSDQTYEDLTARKTYDWFNTNPVLVLKTKLKYKDSPQDRLYCKELIAFNTGKQYLQPYLAKSMHSTPEQRGNFLRSVSLQWTEAELYVNQAGAFLEKMDDKLRKQATVKPSFIPVRSTEDLEPLKIRDSSMAGPTVDRVKSQADSSSRQRFGDR